MVVSERVGTGHGQIVVSSAPTTIGNNVRVIDQPSDDVVSFKRRSSGRIDSGDDKRGSRS